MASKTDVSQQRQRNSCFFDSKTALKIVELNSFRDKHKDVQRFFQTKSIHNSIVHS